MNLIHHCLSSICNIYICPFVLCLHSTVVVCSNLSVVRSVPVVVLAHIITQISGHCPSTSSSGPCQPMSTQGDSSPFYKIIYFLLGSALEQRIQSILLLLLLFLTSWIFWQIRSKKARRPEYKVLNWRRFPELCCVGGVTSNLSCWVNDAVPPFQSCGIVTHFLPGISIRLMTGKCPLSSVCCCSLIISLISGL